MLPDVAGAVLTAEQFALLPDDGHDYELVRGRLVAVPSPSHPHGIFVARLTVALGSHVRQHDLGHLTVDPGYILERRPDSVRGPDIAFLRKERAMHPLGRSDYFEGPPTLAIEVESPLDRRREVEAKVRQYLEAGVERVVLVRPGSRQVIVQEQGDTIDLGPGDVLDGGAAVPGFRYPLADLFA